MAIALSPWAIKSIDQMQRAFLWRGTEMAAGGHCMLAWPRVILEYLQVWDLVTTVALHCDTQDRALWRWTPNQQFSTASAYQAFFIGQYATPGAKVIASSSCGLPCMTAVGQQIDGNAMAYNQMIFAFSQSKSPMSAHPPAVPMSCPILWQQPCPDIPHDGVPGFVLADHRRQCLVLTSASTARAPSTYRRIREAL
ncbi:hypothetical protein HU200_015597 [Digitaria exilis]|uniref:Uncharacterized protein n=1 Tax=Digitaria exilis TaxID=1010633 RepID=A0A835KL36_9POAL|nr:hypothetical protein HU200_015597 [Digitaria exilis]